MTHHFHKYEKAVDARMLDTPFKRSEWETEALRKQRRRKMTVVIDDDMAKACEEKEERWVRDTKGEHLCIWKYDDRRMYTTREKEEHIDGCRRTIV